MVFFDEEDEVHDADAEGVGEELEDGEEGHVGTHHLLPHVGGDVDEVAGHEGQDIVLGAAGHLADAEADQDTEDATDGDEGVAHDCLEVGEAGPEQQTDVAHEDGDFVSVDSDDEGDVLVGVAAHDADADAEAVEDQAQTLSQEHHVAG